MESAPGTYGHPAGTSARPGHAVECVVAEEMSMANGGGKRISSKDLGARVSELERKIAELSEQLAKLDERIQLIANSVAASQASRF